MLSCYAVIELRLLRFRENRDFPGHVYLTETFEKAVEVVTALAAEADNPKVQLELRFLIYKTTLGGMPDLDHPPCPIWCFGGGGKLLWQSEGLPPSWISVPDTPGACTIKGDDTSLNDGDIVRILPELESPGSPSVFGEYGVVWDVNSGFDFFTHQELLVAVHYINAYGYWNEMMVQSKHLRLHNEPLPSDLRFLEFWARVGKGEKSIDAETYTAVVERQVMLRQLQYFDANDETFKQL